MMLIPLTDASRRPTRMPAVTAVLIALNALMFVLELARGEPFVKRWSVTPAEIIAGHHWITILTAMFMHGSWSHIIGNMIFAALAQVAAAPDSTVPNLGASGAIAAVMGAFLVTFPQDRIRSLLVIFVFVRIAYIAAVLLIGVWALTQFLSLGAISQQPAGGGVAYAPHVGGFIFGAVVARLFVRRGSEPKLEWAR